MKLVSTFFSAALLLTASVQCQNWSLQDPSAGWNSKELVTLYYHNSELQTQWAFKALSKYRFQGNERVLDFGSGDGKISALMAYMVPQGSVTGVDLSKEMTHFASSMFPQYAHPNLLFAQTDDVSFAHASFDEKFDLVTSFCVFHLVPYPQVIFEKIQSQMKPGAHFVATFPVKAASEFYQAASVEMKRRGWSFPAPTDENINIRNPEKIREFLYKAGFDILNLEVVSTRNPFASKEEMIDWLEGTCAANWNIPKDDRRQFFTDVTNHYLEYMPGDVGSDGVVYFSINLVNFVAQNQL
ncbi:MAG: class I SAM-dependent methyltransferase [Verrucomicrobia bacterium]|nr:class I SAM-dependent methyltransferase [Verrucomicrobiota bacterium]MBS0636317.1 class I SAM-dependent methyltransferase [Verrucomicrobiota bacterium]